MPESVALPGDVKTMTRSREQPTAYGKHWFLIGLTVFFALIGQLGEEAVATAILVQDAKVLSRASGVGPKLAERIVLELKEKMQQESMIRRIEASMPRPRESKPADDLIEALLALGYRRSEAEAAADQARVEAANVEDQIKAALARLKR